MKLLQFSKRKTILILITLPRRGSFYIQVSLLCFIRVLKGYCQLWKVTPGIINLCLLCWYLGLKVKDNWDLSVLIYVALFSKKGRRSHLVTFYIDYELSLLSLRLSSRRKRKSWKKNGRTISWGRETLARYLPQAPKILRGHSRCFLSVTHNRPSERRTIGSLLCTVSSR